MERRNALKSLGVIAAGLALLPSCSDGLTLLLSEEDSFDFSPKQGLWLNALSQAILPYGDHQITTLETFPDFVQKMIAKTKNEKDIASFINGYNLATAEIKTQYNRSASKITPTEVISYFKNVMTPSRNELAQTPEEKLQLADIRTFTSEVRNMSIYHLTTSQDYMETVDNYHIIPGTYIGSVPV